MNLETVFSYLHIHTNTQLNFMSLWYCVTTTSTIIEKENLPMVQEQNDQDKKFDRFSFSSINLYLNE